MGSAPLRMSSLEVQLAVARLLEGPGFKAVVEAMVTYARRSEAAHNALGDIEGADEWVVRAATLEELLGDD